MIIDLNEPLYVLDNKCREHRVKNIDLLNKIVIDVDNNEYEYSTTPITVVIKS